jgi:hypothetical protein
VVMQRKTFKTRLRMAYIDSNVLLRVGEQNHAPEPPEAEIIQETTYREQAAPPECRSAAVLIEKDNSTNQNLCHTDFSTDAKL